MQDAKIALGERGAPWWEEISADDRSIRLRAAVLALAGHRAPKTICPSDVARTVGGTGWRKLMEPARDVVRTLAHEGAVDVLQRGEVVDPGGTWHGPVRIRARATPPSAA